MLNETYKSILLSKGYIYHDDENLFWKKGVFYQPKCNGVCSYLIMNKEDFHKSQPEGQLRLCNEFEFTLAKDLKEYEKALKLISDFQEREYGESNSYTRLNTIPLAYTTVGEDEETEISVYCNLIDRTITTYYDRVEVEKTEYPSLKSMIDLGLSNLDFDSLVFRDDEWEEKKVEKDRLYLKDHNEKLSFYETIQLLGSMVKVGLLENDYFPENEERPEDRIIIYRKSRPGFPEGWYSENLLSVAQELAFDYESQQALWKELNEKDFEPVFEPSWWKEER